VKGEERLKSLLRTGGGCALASAQAQYDVALALTPKLVSREKAQEPQKDLKKLS
jgi:hypothetical protein